MKINFSITCYEKHIEICADNDKELQLAERLLRNSDMMGYPTVSPEAQGPSETKRSDFPEVSRG